MLKLNHKEVWVPKNWCFQTAVLEKTLESSLDSKEIKAVNPKGDQPWQFIGRTNAEAPILWSPDAKSGFIGKDPDAGKDWRQKKEGAHRRWDVWMASSTQWTWVWANPGRQWRTRTWCVAVHGVAKSRTWLSNWITTTLTIFFIYINAYKFSQYTNNPGKMCILIFKLFLQDF